MNIDQFAGDYLDRLKTVLDAIDRQLFAKMVGLIMDAYHRQARIFIMGNGGSGATASHLVCDINKGCSYDVDRKFQMICLNDNMPTVLALANDVGYESVFEAQIKNFFQAGDLVIGISGSGNSENVLRAIAWAAQHGGRTVGWTGMGGGRLAGLVDLALVADSQDMQQIEDVHCIIGHMLMQAVFEQIHGHLPCNTPDSDRQNL